MAKGYTLDRRAALYGERRLSDRQVELLRSLRGDGLTIVPYNVTFFAMMDRFYLRAGARTSSGVYARLTDRGRKVLALIDTAAAAS